MLSGDDRGWGVVTEEKHLSAVGFQPSPPWFGGCRLLQWGGFVQEQEYEQQQGGEGQLWEELQVKEETLPWPNRWAFDPDSWRCTCVFGLITHWLFEKSVELPDVLVNTWDDRHLILPNFDTYIHIVFFRSEKILQTSLLSSKRAWSSSKLFARWFPINI